MSKPPPTSLVVHLDIVEARLDEFLAIVRAHGANSQQIEPGCLQFEVLIPQEPSSHVILFEVYSDYAALESHWDSEHMAEYRRKIKGMIVNRTVYRCGPKHS
jgi:quinol monooxygenase YgiN